MTRFTLHRGDLPSGMDFGSSVAVDSETMGLQIGRDRLCLVQLSAGDGTAHLVQMGRPGPDGRFHAPNLAALLADRSVTKLFHFARFDVAVLGHSLGITVSPVYCTKIASRLTRTYTDRHGLKDLVKEVLGVEISKQQQSSDWGADELTEEQLAYAASDVLYLHALRQKLDRVLEREGRTEVAAACFAFLPARADLDRMGWPGDIFEH
ncbi:MAG: ribonuclease D [Alphaproteobacteria bacterium]|nr:ribonuclease D [Alphaproteobacteria bacterium]TAD90558.1 MAG: ribonuclease D [Alphaproteobacteria bacterium]